MNFLKNILSTLVALTIFSVLSFFIFIGVFSALTAEKPVEVEGNSVLHLKLNKPIDEMEQENPLEEIFPVSPEILGLIQLKEAISKAKEDDNIKGIYLNAPYVQAGIATVEELREALLDFKTSGKFVVAYGEFFTEGAYYLASVADKVYLHPEGELELNGLSANLAFFKGMLEKLEIEPQVFRVGDFKSYVETYTREDMSPENRVQMESLLNSINQEMLGNLAESRNKTPEEVKEISDKMLIHNPQDAKRLSMVDELFYEDQVLDELKKLAGTAEEDDLEMISYSKFRKSYSTYKSSKNRIAVIVASGDIIPGKGDNNTIGSDKFAKEIRKARENDDIKAIVMRIKSPGGSFLASEVMWREIELASQVKPVIASMSDVAASGGYYMAMACDTIVAQPNTITGSIGIFTIIFNAQGFLNNKLGITTDEVSTGEISTLYTMSRPLSEAQRKIIQKNTDEGYETFVSKAAAGRGMSVDDIKAIASGRVWSGMQAVENGLVDQLGGLDDAIAIAAEKAGIADDYKVRYYPEQKPFLEQLLSDLEGEARVKFMKEEMNEFYPFIKQYERVKNLQGLQTRLPFELHLE